MDLIDEQWLVLESHTQWRLSQQRVKCLAGRIGHPVIFLTRASTSTRGESLDGCFRQPEVVSHTPLHWTLSRREM